MGAILHRPVFHSSHSSGFNATAWVLVAFLRPDRVAKAGRDIVLHLRHPPGGDYDLPRHRALSLWDEVGYFGSVVRLTGLGRDVDSSGNFVEPHRIADDSSRTRAQVFSRLIGAHLFCGISPVGCASTIRYTFVGG
jgi:hypothetical protein